jgi:hypothetical protein
MIVTTIAALKALTCGGEADVLGYYTPGDGGGGRFYFDATSTATDDTGLVIAPTGGSGRWIRIRYDSAVSVDWFAAPGGDYAAAFGYASAYQNVVCSQKSYLMNGTISIRAGQAWNFNGALIYHTDDTKVMFDASAVNNWALIGPCTLVGMLSSSGTTGEKGVHVAGCNSYRVSAMTARLFKGPGFHIEPGTFAGFKGDQGQWSDCAGYENMVPLQVDNGAGAEYNTFTNFNASGNVQGPYIAAGNTTMIGGSICQNNTGVYLSGGTNNGHGIFSGVNINHNGAYNIRANGVTNGHTFIGCHIYGDSSTAGLVLFENGSTDIVIIGGVLDSKVVNDSGTNHVINNKTYGQFAVAGSNAAGLIQSGNF